MRRGSGDVRLREDCHNSLLQMNLELEDANPQRMETAALSADPQLPVLNSHMDPRGSRYFIIQAYRA